MHFLASWRRLEAKLGRPEASWKRKSNWAACGSVQETPWTLLGSIADAPGKRPARPGAPGHVLVRPGVPLGLRSLGSINILDMWQTSVCWNIQEFD